MKILTTKEVSEKYNIPRAKLLYLSRKKQLPHAKLGTMFYFVEKELRDYILSGGNQKDNPNLSRRGRKKQAQTP